MNLPTRRISTLAAAATAAAAAVTSASGALVSYFNMEQGASPIVDQATGFEAAASGAGHQYSIAGPAGFGNAVALTDNGSWLLSAADSAALRNLANNFTVASWINLSSATIAGKTGTNATLNRIIGDDVAWDADGWSFGVFNDGRVRFTKNGIIDGDVGVAGSVPLDQWVHVAATISSADGITVFVNGDVLGNNPNTADNNLGPGNNAMDDPWGVGRSYGDGQAQWFAGAMDEVRVYDTVLSQEEIRGLLVPEPSSLVMAVMGSLVLLRRSRRRR